MKDKSRRRQFQRGSLSADHQQSIAAIIVRLHLHHDDES
jgi:hypothetical protein